ncbi:MAG: OPT/YSL family transporter [Candidatus Thorarchaeota archaeon]
MTRKRPSHRRFLIDIPLARKLPPDRALLVGLYVGGVAYASLSLSRQGLLGSAALIALLIEIVLLAGSFLPKSLDKKQLFALTLIMAIYLLVSILTGAFVHSLDTVVMATAGLIIFGFTMSDPKFPLTRRAMATGIIVGIVFTFLGIYLTLKVGVMLAIGAELLGFLILSTQGRYTPEENTIVVTIANGSAMMSVGVLIIFPAIAIFLPQIDPIGGPTLVMELVTLPFMIFVTFVTGLCGLILLAPFRDRFDGAPWPQVAPQAETIRSMAAESGARKPILIGMGASAAWVAARESVSAVAGRSMSAIPNAIVPAVPDWIGVSNSPLLASLGFFMGWKRVIVIFTGSIASMLIWVFLESADITLLFSEHLHRPEILYLALGVFAVVILGDVLKKKEEPEEGLETKDQEIDEEEELGQSDEQKTPIAWIRFSFDEFKTEVKEMAHDPRGYLKSRRGQLPVWVAFVSLVLFVIIGLIFFYFFEPFPGIHIDVLLFVLGTPLALVSAYFTAVAVSETGLLAGFISDVVAIPAIIFFRVSFQTITTFMALLSGLQNAALAALVHLKLGQVLGVRGRDIMKALLFSLFVASTMGPLIIYMIFISPFDESQFGFGGSEFPSPTAQLFGFLVISLSGLTDMQLPGTGDEGVSIPLIGQLMFPFDFVYLIAFGIVGGLAGRYLLQRDLSPISLAVGLLIPPATAVAMLLGGLVDYRLKKKRRELDPVDEIELEQVKTERKKTNRILSGAVSGEAIVTVIFVMVQALLLFAIV